MYINSSAIYYEAILQYVLTKNIALKFPLCVTLYQNKVYILKVYVPPLGENAGSKTGDSSYYSHHQRTTVYEHKEQTQHQRGGTQDFNGIYGQGPDSLFAALRNVIFL